MADIAQRPDGNWVEVMPSHCLNGHRWGKGDYIAGSTGGQGTRYWICKTCGAEIRDAVTEPKEH
jgi:hypothetical protein